MSEPLRLYTFSMSHFSEKIRWAMGLEKIAFEEVPWTPPFHVVPARMSGAATTVPVLEMGAQRIQDSTRILHWLDTNRGPLSLLPIEEAARQDALAIEARFDDIGSGVIRLAYNHVLTDTNAVVKLWTIDASPMQAFAVRAGFPFFRVLLRRRLDMRPEAIATSQALLESGLAFIEERTASKPYLVSDRLTIADVSAAALLSPFVCPDEHPVYASEVYRAGIAPLVAPWKRRPAFDWVKRIYREHRGEWPRRAHVTAALA